MGIRFFAALWVCKAVRLALRVLKRGGTTLPGKLAFKLYPDILAQLSSGVDTLIITGTNGKTTTSRMAEQIMLSARVPCIANRSGANLMSGVVTEFADNVNLFGKKRLHHAVIECDEAAFSVVTKYLKPRAIAVTNIFRDQLDRYGEVTHTLECIRTGIKNSAGAALCLNADCPLTASLAQSAAGEVTYFGMNVPSDKASGALSDVPRCLRCGGSYEYDFRTFAHLGGWRCTDCDSRRPEPDVAVSAVASRGADETRAHFSAFGEALEITVPLPGDYNLYNAATALCVTHAMGIDSGTAAAGIEQAHCGFGRMERFDLGDISVRMILVKNPAGCDRALDYLTGISEAHTCVFCLNDNIADGTDISWIWDAGFERLSFSEGKRFAVSGTRAEDMALRLKYAGAAEEDILKIRSEAQLLDFIERSGENIYILPTYTAMLSLRDKLGARCGKERFWR